MRVAWFSAGVSSFVATYLSKPDRVVYIDIVNQHPDTQRFIADCEKLLGMEIEVIRDTKYGASVDEVIKRKRYINGVGGAPCTLNLKKRVREEWERQFVEPLTYIWGYDANERRRAERLASTAIEYSHEFPLIERGMTKEQVHGFAASLGLKRPAMYDLGYPNNNCIGCVKGGMGYWNKIRVDFPEVFERRAHQEREIGHSCIKGVFLDELEPNRGRMVSVECQGVCTEVVGE